MKHVKIYRNKIPTEVLVTHLNRVTGKKETHHYCFRANKAKSLLLCSKIDGNRLEKTSQYAMSFVLGNFYVPMKLEKFLKLKAFL